MPRDDLGQSDETDLTEKSMYSGGEDLRRLQSRQTPDRKLHPCTLRVHARKILHTRSRSSAPVRSPPKRKSATSTSTARQTDSARAFRRPSPSPSKCCTPTRTASRGKATSSVTMNEDVLLYVPSPSIMPFTVKGVGQRPWRPKGRSTRATIPSPSASAPRSS